MRRHFSVVRGTVPQAMNGGLLAARSSDWSFERSAKRRQRPGASRGRSSETRRMRPARGFLGPRVQPMALPSRNQPAQRAFSPEDFPRSRTPVDLDGETSWRFPAQIRGCLTWPAANPLVSRQIPRRTSAYAFSPTCNSAGLKGTPQPPIPQYPSGFLARYCWW